MINKIDLAPHVGASLDKMRTDATRMRGERPFVMTNLKKSEGLDQIIRFIEKKGGLRHTRRAGGPEFSGLQCMFGKVIGGRRPPMKDERGFGTMTGILEVSTLPAFGLRRTPKD